MPGECVPTPSPFLHPSGGFSNLPPVRMLTTRFGEEYPDPLTIPVLATPEMRRQREFERKWGLKGFERPFLGD